MRNNSWPPAEFANLTALLVVRPFSIFVLDTAALIYYLDGELEQRLVPGFSVADITF